MKTVQTRPPLPHSHWKGTFHAKDAEKWIKQLSASPKTPEEAKAIVAQAMTFDYGSPLARDTVDAFINDQLPKLVQMAPKGVVDRDYPADIRTQTWNGKMDGAGAQAATGAWQAPMARIQEQMLEKDVAAAAPQMDADAQKVMKNFFAKVAPKWVTDPDVDQQFADKVTQGKGQVDDKGAKQLITGWKQQVGGMRLTEANAIRDDVKKFDKKLNSAARARLNKFVEKTLSSLVLKQDLTSPHKATLSWTPPTTNTDGSPLNDLAGYLVLQGTTAGVYTGAQSVTDPSAVQFIVPNLPSGTHFFAMKAVDTQGNESAPSNTVSITVP